jgi:hypothetical protein
MSPKKRGGDEHGKTTAERNSIRLLSLHLYLMLSHWIKRNRDEYPVVLTQYLRAVRYDIKKYVKPITATREIINLQFRMNLRGDDDSTFGTFYKHYIADRNLSSLRKTYRENKYFRKSPLSLSPFSEYIKQHSS